MHVEPFIGSEALANGLVRKHQLRTNYRAVFPNVYVPHAEWGGFKRSGIGRELGPTGLDEYREAKHIYQNTAPAPTGWFSGK